MVTRKLVALFSISLVIAVTVSAYANIPDMEMSTASTAVGDGVTPFMFNLPNGQGSSFAQARVADGVVDATITLHVRDSVGEPVTWLSAYDMWLETEVTAGSGNFAACTMGTTADFNTNAAGLTRWAAPLRAGGWSSARTLIYILGMPLTSNTGLMLQHNSADSNSDGEVNLVDIQIFAEDFHGAYSFRSDLFYDGVVNLNDIPRLARSLGATCP